MIIHYYKKICQLLSVLATLSLTAQYRLHIIAIVPPNTNEAFLTGSFNNWNASNVNYRLTPSSNRQMEITLEKMGAGAYQLNFTRGNSLSYECTSAALAMKPHIVYLKCDTTIQFAIAAWSDAYFDTRDMPDLLLYEVMTSRAGYYAEINLDSSYKYAVQLTELAKKLHDPIKEARALDLQAIIFNKQGNSKTALDMLYKSLAIKKLLQDSSGASFTYLTIGNLYEGINDLPKAINNYERSVDWTEKAFEYMKSIPFTNIGRIFLLHGYTDSAFLYAARAIKINQNSAEALLLSGDIQQKNGKNERALNYYKEALYASALRIPGSPFYSNNAMIYKRMADLFYNMNFRDTAFYYARKAFAISAGLKSPSAIISSGATLMGFFERERAFDSAFFYQKLVSQKKDSLFTLDKEKQIHNIFFTEKLRQKDAEAQEVKNKTQRKIYLLTGLVTALLLTGIAYRLKLKASFSRRLAQLEMRALRAQMNPHFIFNCLASINRYIIMSDTKIASAYLTKFSRLIRLILDNSTNELVSIDTEIQTLTLYLEMESLRFDNAFEYEIQQEKLVRSDNTAIPTMIIQPYVENAIWHGLLHLVHEMSDKTRGKLWVRFVRLTDDCLRVEIEDNGIGRKRAAELNSKDAVKMKSYGMQISKDRIRIINSQFNTKSSVSVEDLADDRGNGAGTKITLHLPVIEMAVQPGKPIK